MNDIEAYNVARDKMLLTGNPQALLDFQTEYGLQRASSLEVAEVALHKIRTCVLSLPREVRRESWLWLTKRGYSTWDDGDLADS